MRPLRSDDLKVPALSNSYRGKRLFDLIVAVPALLVLSPLLLLLAAIIRMFLGAPVLFRQQRPGLHGKVFTCLKFRTMTDKLDNNGKPLPDGARLTRVGRFLRASSLDELPELINVIAGEMSLVGPRPLLIQYLELYNEDQARRHSLLPGITGWAADPRSQRSRMASKIRARCLVCRPLFVLARREDTLAYGLAGL